MAKDGTAIACTEISSAMRRPMRSPMWPNSSPPSGRVTKATANTAYEATSDSRWFPSGKKFAANVAARKP
jgi:hypothetical protein